MPMRAQRNGRNWGSWFAAGLLQALLVCWLVACSNSAEVTRGDGQTITAARNEDANGVKFRVAVGQILDKSGAQATQSVVRQISLLNAGRDKTHQIDPASVTHGIRDMIVTELFNSGQFIVLDREDLPATMFEQDFSQSARVGDTTRIPLGKLEGADLLVVGALTAFDTGTGSEGGAIPIPIPLGASAKYGLGVLNIGYKRGYAAMDLRVVDVATGRVLASTAVEGKNTNWGVDFNGLFSVGGGTIPLPGLLKYFSNTPVEDALQKMVTAAIGTITAQKPTRAVISPAPTAVTPSITTTPPAVAPAPAH
jgi:curli biogenesis system outer membrane secretion channel CsgG